VDAVLCLTRVGRDEQLFVLEDGPLAFELNGFDGLHPAWRMRADASV
jgi:hypothetical protein